MVCSYLRRQKTKAQQRPLVVISSRVTAIADLVAGGGRRSGRATQQCAVASEISVRARRTGGQQGNERAEQRRADVDDAVGVGEL
jgi:hypothetical protein